MLTRLIPRLIHQRCFSTVHHQEDVGENSTRRILADSSTSLPLIIPTSGVPIHLYTRELESQALRQLIVLAESGIVKGFVAAMADVHVGKYNQSTSSFGLGCSRCWCNYWNSFRFCH